MSKLSIEIVEFKPMRRNTLRGFAKIRIPAMRMVISDVAIHEKDGSRWAQLPSKPILDASRNIATDDEGKPRYVRIFEFDDQRVSRAFSDAVLAAFEQGGWSR